MRVADDSGRARAHETHAVGRGPTQRADDEHAEHYERHERDEYEQNADEEDLVDVAVERRDTERRLYLPQSPLRRRAGGVGGGDVDVDRQRHLSINRSISVSQFI